MKRTRIVKLVCFLVTATCVGIGCSGGASDTGFFCSSGTTVVTSASCAQVKTDDKCDSTSFYVDDAGTGCCNFTNCQISPPPP